MRTLAPRSGAERALVAVAVLLGSVATLATVDTTSAHAAADGASSRDYAALGDSYASAPAVPDQVDDHCLRSSHNYPSLVAQVTGARLKDASCSGATTAEMTAAQGTAAAQFSVLGRGTDVVTLTIGGNDIGFTTVMGTCAQLAAADTAGAPCRSYYAGEGTDQISQTIAQTAPKVREVLRGIHEHAPHAHILVVGYPDLFPEDGVGCTSATAPLAAGDFAYLRDKEKELNAMLARQARREGAFYVDTYTPTLGHDLCSPAGQRWIEDFSPLTPAAPLHPNAQGEAAMADAVTHAVVPAA